MFYFPQVRQPKSAAVSSSSSLRPLKKSKQSGPRQPSAHSASDVPHPLPPVSQGQGAPLPEPAHAPAPQDAHEDLLGAFLVCLISISAISSSCFFFFLPFLYLFISFSFFVSFRTWHAVSFSPLPFMNLFDTQNNILHKFEDLDVVKQHVQHEVDNSLKTNLILNFHEYANRKGRLLVEERERYWSTRLGNHQNNLSIFFCAIHFFCKVLIVFYIVILAVFSISIIFVAVFFSFFFVFPFSFRKRIRHIRF